MSEPVEEERAHAILSPSGADRWMTCLGSTALTKDLPDVTSSYAEEGTDYHFLAEVCLNDNANAMDYVGQELPSGALVTAENARLLQDGYIEPVRAHAEFGTLLVEEELPLTWLTGEPKAKGTVDALIIPEGDELFVDDLKFGMGVEVEVDDNRQLKIYAAAALEKHGLWDLVKTVRLGIFQPRIGEGKPKEWVITVQDLKKFCEEEVRPAASMIFASLRKGVSLALVPSVKAGKFCKAKADCPALEGFVDQAMMEGFEDLTKKQPTSAKEEEVRADRLGRMMQKADLCEIWMKGVRTQCDIDMLAGLSVTGYKLVQGKKGNRKWKDEEAVEAVLKGYRMKKEEIYNIKLISPTDAEKLLEKAHPRRWEEVKTMYEQKDGVPSVAPESDKRPAISIGKPTDGFEDVTIDDLI